MKQNGKLIVCEGLDSCGKSTQSKLLADNLRAAGHSVCLVMEPGSTAIGELIRGILLNNNERSARTELMLFMTARSQSYAEAICPALERNQIVISDRWAWSTYAYQFEAIPNDDLFKELANYVYMQREPDISFIFDVDLATMRARQNKVLDKIESRSDEYFDIVLSRYRSIHLLTDKPVQLIDGTSSIEVISQKLLAYLQLYRIL